MRKLYEKIWKKEEGFTLIELIIVIAILAIISAIAIPNVLSAVDNSRKTTDISNAKIIADAAATVRAKNDTYATTTFDTGSALNITDEVIADVGDDVTFGEALYAYLNSNPPTPVYKGIADTDDFMLVMLSDGTIRVYTGDDDEDHMVYPTPDSEYANQ